MTTYSIRDLKAKLSEVLRNLENGQQVVITRRGKPCGMLIGITESESPPLSTLKGTQAYLPDANYEDFLQIKGAWEPADQPPLTEFAISDESR